MIQEKSYTSWFSGCIQGIIRYIKEVPGFDLNPTSYRSKKFDEDFSNV